nr:MAG TPA: hypothetical protein [Caudoviricetes sp.]
MNIQKMLLDSSHKYNKEELCDIKLENGFERFKALKAFKDGIQHALTSKEFLELVINEYMNWSYSNEIDNFEDWMKNLFK